MNLFSLFSLFSGIGAFEKALSRQNIQHEIVGYSEIDKYASKNYSLIHGVSEDLNYGDITKIDTDKLPNFDLMTWGFPCQDLSVAGKGQGIKEGTRSGLYYEGYRILKAKLPKISIIENVKALISKKHIESFKMILSDLESLGYTNYWQVLNAKDYGIPQNRERVFIISILGEHKPFEFPVKQELKLKLKDMLEDEVDEKYYIKSEKTKSLLKQLDWVNKEIKTCDMSVNNPKFRDVGNCIKARYDCGISNQKSEGVAVIEATKQGYAIAEEGDSINIQFPNSTTRRGRVGKQVAQTIETSCNQATIIQVSTAFIKPKFIGNIYGKDFGTGYAGGVWDKNHVCPTLTTMQGGGRQPHIIERTPLKFLNRNGKNTDGDYSFCVDTSHTGGIKETYEDYYRVRKLTPLECWRLMGFDDFDFEKVRETTSNTQLYKQAGNSIVVNVLEEIMKEVVKSVDL